MPTSSTSPLTRASIPVTVCLQRRAGPPLYSMFYAPYDGPGGMVPDRQIAEPDQLREFLGNSLHINQGTVESAVRNLEERGSATIPNVELKSRDLRPLGLA